VITLNAQVFNEIEFKGDIDLIAGEFSRGYSLKGLVHIGYSNHFYKGFGKGSWNPDILPKRGLFPKNLVG